MDKENPDETHPSRSYIAYWDDSASIGMRERIEKWLQQLGYRVKACEKMTIIDWEEPHDEAEG